MPYTKNPNLPRVRMEAVNLVKQGWSIRKAAKHFGYSHCAVRLWLKKKPVSETYLPYYNNKRLHLGINFLTPLEWLQAIG